MDSPPTDHDDRILWNEIAFIFIVFRDHVNHSRFCDGPITHDFFNDAASVRKVWFIVPCRRPRIPDHPVKFLVSSCHDFWMQCKLQHKTIQCQCCGIGTRLCPVSELSGGSTSIIEPLMYAAWSSSIPWSLQSLLKKSLAKHGGAVPSATSTFN